MSDLEFTPPTQFGLIPRRLSCCTTASYATITAAGWINTLITENIVVPNSIDNNDIFSICYAYDALTGVGIDGEFLVTINGSGVMTLSPYIMPGLQSGVTPVWGGGGTSHAFAVSGITASSIVTADILASTNSVSINSVVPSTNTLTITFSADPGAATSVQYIATASAL